MSESWFSVHRAGLAKLLRGKGLEFIVYEPIQNSWDENTTRVAVELTWDGKRRRATLTVEDDDPDGFKDLTHAFTLFAESAKKADPEKRGRFNLGEKLVLACCEEASIATTTGTIVFDKDGRRHKRTKREAGSLFRGVIPMKKAEVEAICEAVRMLIPPTGIVTTFNGEELKRPSPVRVLPAVRLQTEIAGEDGVPRPTKRKCAVHLFAADGPAWLYEMGIPVVELEQGDPWHLDVQQKVPLTMDRENVRPAFLRDLRVQVLNATHDLLSVESANGGWAREAMKRDEVSDEAVEAALSLRFGDKRVSYDPSDTEANKIATSMGYTVVTGSQLTKEEWANAKRAGAILPAGKVTPSPKIEVASHGGRDVEYLAALWSEEMFWVVDHTQRLGSALVGEGISVSIINDFEGSYLACYGRPPGVAGGVLEFNVARLGKTWFQARAAEGPLSVDLNRLVIHELGHHYSDDHLSSDYHEALCRLGAGLAALATDQPELLTRFGDAA